MTKLSPSRIAIVAVLIFAAGKEKYLRAMAPGKMKARHAVEVEPMTEKSDHIFGKQLQPVGEGQQCHCYGQRTLWYLRPQRRLVWKQQFIYV
ncbi:hypothetical protein SDJN03_03760, partial [Cucurbita argyrosperma subsp. sororia]